MTALIDNVNYRKVPKALYKWCASLYATYESFLFFMPRVTVKYD